MNNEELQQLKALAQAATPGPWYVQFGDNDSAYIAAANPAAILALIAKVESLAADAERYKLARGNSQQYYFAYRNPDMGHAFSQVSGKEMDKVIDSMAKDKP